MKALIAVIATVLLTLVSALASAHDYTLGDLTIKHPWSRPTPPGASMGVGYLTITNNGEKPAVLASASSTRADNVTIHESAMKDGLMRMQAVTGGLTIPAGATVEFRPNGYHLMFHMVKGNFQPGERVAVTLDFADSGSIDVELAVEDLDKPAKKAEPKHDMSMHGKH